MIALASVELNGKLQLAAIIGSVAMVVSANPGLLEIDHGVSGAASTHVHDFWRPLGMREAQVDGHYSVQCYLDAVATAYRGWKARAIERGLVRGAPGEQASEQLARICYHVPFCKMARKAHVHVRKTEAEDASATWDAAAEQQGIASFKQQVEPSLGLCARVGNVYTGSLYLGLAGLLQAQAAGLAGQRIGMFSYGSGCTSEFFSGVVGKAAAARIAAAKLGDMLDEREKISVTEYERIMAMAPTAPITDGPAGDGFRFTGVTNHQRQYAKR